MDFKVKKHVEVDELSQEYPFDLQMYTYLSDDIEVSLTEFEEYAIERVKVLRTLEQISLKEQFTNFEDFKMKVVASLNQQGLNTYKKLILHTSGDDIYEARRRDHLSHFMLRLVYCQTEEYRKFFVAKEWDLFKLRWVGLNKEMQKAFLKANCINVTPLNENAIACLNESSGGYIRTTVEYYSVKWTEVTDLVRQRKVYLEHGTAYISSDDLIHVLAASFKSALSHTLTVMSHRYAFIEEDERMTRLIRNLHNAYVGKSYVTNDSNKVVPLQSLDKLSKTSFPPCMKQLYAALKTEHHLKHTARQHLGLFLKGIGLPLEDALTLWKREFTKKMDVDQFDKRYAYGIRYNYGKEGKKTNYTPYSCGKIINSSPGAGEYHGCPFKHNDVQSLKQMFTSLQISQQDINEILQFRNMNQFQLACAKFFEVTQKVPLLVPINHPNQYFEEAIKAGGVELPGPSSVKNLPSAIGNGPQSEEQNPSSVRDIPTESEINAMDWGDDTI